MVAAYKCFREGPSYSSLSIPRTRPESFEHIYKAHTLLLNYVPLCASYIQEVCKTLQSKTTDGIRATGMDRYVHHMYVSIKSTHHYKLNLLTRSSFLAVAREPGPLEEDY